MSASWPLHSHDSWFDLGNQLLAVAYINIYLWKLRRKIHIFFREKTKWIWGLNQSLPGGFLKLSIFAGQHWKVSYFPSSITPVAQTSSACQPAQKKILANENCKSRLQTELKTMRDSLLQHCLIVWSFVDLLKICLLIKNSKNGHQIFINPLTKTPFCCAWKPSRNSSIGRNNKGFSPLQHSLSVISVFIWQFHRSQMPDKAFWPLSMIGLFYDLVRGMDTNVCLATKKIAFPLWSTADADTSTIIS